MIDRIKKLFLSYGIGGVQKSLHIAISQSFIALLFILTDFIFSKELTVAEFGVWKEVFFFFNLGIPLLGFGLPEGYKYFIAKDDNLNGYFRNITSILLLVSLLLFIVIGAINLFHWLGYINIGNYFGYSLLFPLPLLAYLLNKVLRYTYINQDQAQKLTRLSIYGAIGSLLFIVAGSFFIAEHREQVMIAAVLIYFLIFFFPAFFYFQALSIASYRFSIDRKIIRRMLQYGIPLYLATFTGLLSNYLDKLIVNISSDEATFAIFAVGAFEIPIFAMLSAAFSQQIFPKMVGLVEEGKEAIAKNLWMETTKKVSLITYPVILLAMFFAEEIIFLIYNENYAASVVLFKTYLLVALFRNNSYGILLTSKGETKIITKVSAIILLLNIIFSLSFYYWFGLRGVVFGTLLSTIIMWLFYLLKEDLFKLYTQMIFKNKILSLLVVLILLLYFT